MAENNIPNPPALGQDLDYDGDAAYRTYLNSVAPPVPLGQLQEFCPAEIPMRASLLRGDSALMKTFLSRGFLLSSISVTALPIQIVQLIRAVSTFFQLEPDWLNLPANWLTPDQMLFVQSNQFSIYVTLRLEITAGSDGDGINEFELEPADVDSQSNIIYPACATIAGLVSPSATRSYSPSVLIQFLPLSWNAARRMETVLVRNFPFDNFGAHTKLLLHLLGEYFDSCLRKHGQEELEYYIVITPAPIGKSKTNEGIARVFLPPILPGLNMDLPSTFCNAVGLTSTQPVIISFGWTQLLMAGNIGDLLRADYLAQFGTVIPQEMTITGVSPGTPLPAALVSLWADVNWSPSCFDHIDAAYFDRSAPYSAHPTLVTPETLLSHGVSDTLHLIVASRAVASSASRFFVGQAMGELMGVGPKGQPLTPLASGLSPSDMPLYVKHVKAYLAQITPIAGPTPSGRGRAGRIPLRLARASSRTGRATGSVSVPPVPKLVVIDAEVRARSQLAMWESPLLSDVIPPGGQHVLCPLLHSWPSLQHSWIQRIAQWIMRRTWMIWMRNTRPGLTLVPMSAPLSRFCLRGNFKLSLRTAPECFHGSSAEFPPSDYTRYYASVLSLPGLLPPTTALPSSPTWLQQYNEYLQRVPSNGLVPRLAVHSSPELSDVPAYQMYCDRVACLSNSSPTIPSNSRLHRLQRRGRIGCTTIQSSLREEEYATYYNLVSARTNLSARHRLRPTCTLLPPLAWSGVPSSYASSSLYSASGLRGPSSLSTSSRRISSRVSSNLPPEEQRGGTLSMSAVPLPVSDAALPALDGSRLPLPIDVRRSPAAAPSQADLSLGGSSGLLQVCIPGQDPIPCLGEGDGKGDPPCRFVPQGGPVCRASPYRYPLLGSQGGPGTREDPPLWSPREGGGTEPSYSAPGTTGQDPHSD